MKGFLLGVTIGIVFFLTADYMSTRTSDRFKKTIFESGYRSAMGDFREAIEKKDTAINFREKIDEHWEGIKTIYKNGEEN